MDHNVNSISYDDNTSMESWQSTFDGSFGIGDANKIRPSAGLEDLEPSTRDAYIKTMVGFMKQVQDEPPSIIYTVSHHQCAYRTKQLHWT